MKFLFDMITHMCVLFCFVLFHLVQVTNTFHFTFTMRPEVKASNNGFRIRNVVPATEEEARRILERMDAETSS